MKKTWIAALVFALMLALVPAARAELGIAHLSVGEYPVVDGSTATLPLSYALMAEWTGVTIEEAKKFIRHGKTTESFYALIDGDTELLLAYEPSRDVFLYAQTRGVELVLQPIGRDALVFLTNEKNPVDGLTSGQIVDIYSGKILSWAEVGGEELPIAAYQRAESSGSQVMMRNQVMKDVEMMEAPTTMRTGEMGELVDMIASYENEANALGYSVYYYVANMYMQPGIKLLPIDGVEPTSEAIATQSYPFTQEFYAVIRADAPDDSVERRIFDWLSTDAGRALIRSAGYVSVES